MTDPVERAILECAEASKDIETWEYRAERGLYINDKWAAKAWARWQAAKARLTAAAKQTQRDVKHGVRFDPIDLRKVVD